MSETETSQERDALRVLAEFARTAPGRLPQRVQDALAVADAAALRAPLDREAEEVLRWIDGLTVHPDDAQILPASMSHVTQSAFVQIVQDRVRRALAGQAAPRDTGAEEACDKCGDVGALAEARLCEACCTLLRDAGTNLSGALMEERAALARLATERAALDPTLEGAAALLDFAVAIRARALAGGSAWRCFNCGDEMALRGTGSGGTPHYRCPSCGNTETRGAR